jgi:hypothetical protein
MLMLLGLLAGLAGLGSLICWILVLIKLFPAEGVGLGILGIICGLYTFIWGWQHADENNQRQLMMIWTVCFIAGIILNVLTRGMAPAVTPTGVPGV